MKNLNRIILSISVFLAVALIISGCAGTTGTASANKGSETVKVEQTQQTVQTQKDENTKTFTKDQLLKYDGQNGNPAYVAVDGVVYDVTNVKGWNNGSHNGVQAGRDLTDAIKNKSPHGTSVLEGLPVVGKYVN